MGCNVVFHVLVPDDLTATPYILFTSHGTHSHPPPPPNKPPQEMVEEILDLIRRLQEPGLTLGMLAF